ncbi:MAG: hypothetical protein N3F63_05390 [Thermoplasmata archaeon]|nr:hypothetical protein [Thermoplasmata archaeon]
MQRNLSGKNKIYIYPSAWKIEYCEIADYLTELTGIAVDIRGPFSETFKVDAGKLAADFAAARIFDIFSTSCAAIHESYAIVGIEREFITEKKPVYGVLYDASRVAGLLRKWIPSRERGLHSHHIVFLDRLIATHTGERYHARMVYCSLPSIISTLGMIQAPARPREFYNLRNANPCIPEEVLLEQFRDKMLTYDDTRITEVAKGLALQTVLWVNGFEPFCESPTCKLYNAHWQEELIRSQIGGRICKKHQKIFQRIKSNQNKAQQN